MAVVKKVGLNKKEEHVMDNLWIYILIVVLIVGGSCTVVAKKKNKKK